MSETEPTGSPMSPERGTSKESGKIEERRSFHRETLTRHVVLVFFGEDNWGKLTNMSETGMAIEFAKPPSLRERVNFTFQAMGCMPMPRDGKALGDSFEAPGEIVWTREFERGAGVQFVDLAETSREQIREWLSFETSTHTSKLDEVAKAEVPPILAELLAPIEPRSKTQSAEKKKKTWNELGMPVPLAEVEREADFSFLESSVAGESYDAPGWGDQEEPPKEPRVPEWPVTSHPSVARLTFLVVSGCLAAFAVTAGVRIYMTRAAQRAEAEVHAADPASAPAPSIGEPTAEVNVSSPVPAPASLPSASAASNASPVTSSPPIAPPFQVDVLDANGRNWILWFVNGGAKNKGNQPAYRPGEPFNSSAPTVKTTKRKEEALPEKPQATHTFTMVAPNVSHALSNGAASRLSAAAPAIQLELTPSSGNPLGGALGGQIRPAAPVVHAPVGGMVQQPRLIRTAPLFYPQLARTTRVSGDVLVDALIDTTGKVTAVKALSGPALLRQAAMETVRQWRYEPARLDGQAVAMHLTVTVRFRLN